MAYVCRVVIALLVVYQPCLAVTYFISSSNPNASDSGPGTDPARPWATLGRATGVPLGPGDGLALRTGDVFTLAAEWLLDGLVGNGTDGVTIGSWVAWSAVSIVTACERECAADTRITRLLTSHGLCGIRQRTRLGPSYTAGAGQRAATADDIGTIMRSRPPLPCRNCQAIIFAVP
jgi:hypothetical protein